MMNRIGRVAWAGVARRALSGALAGALVLAAGCGGGNGEPDRAGLGSAAPVTARCPADGLARFNTAVYVSALKGTDNDSCGATSATACSSIGQGIKQCGATGCAVLVRHGLYPTTATITLRDGVSVQGSCRFDGEPDRKYRTVIQASPPAGTPAIAGAGINSETTVSGLVVIGKDETANGAPSIAMAVSASKGLFLANMTLAAGKGGDGAAGTPSAGGPGEDGRAPGFPGDYGRPGGACLSHPTSGAGNGGAGARFNDFFTSACAAECKCHPYNHPGTVSAAGQASGNAAGGAGRSPAGSGCGCDTDTGNRGNPPTGATGGRGEPGQCGATGGSKSSLAFGQPALKGTSWVGAPGGAGATGAVGAGGGGGGAGGYGVDISILGNQEYPGYPGGGGGGGGCGGPGGVGGQQGGASIALVLIDSVLDRFPTNDILVPGPGGHGGNGANGAAGGAGGQGGPGYAGSQVLATGWLCSAAPTPGLGGPGGAGGQGGAGAGGAGGNGGPSIGIAIVGPSPELDVRGIYAGLPGAGGAKGTGTRNSPDPAIDPNPCTSPDGEAGMAGGTAAATAFGKE